MWKKTLIALGLVLALTACDESGEGYHYKITIYDNVRDTEVVYEGESYSDYSDGNNRNIVIYNDKSEKIADLAGNINYKVERVPD